MAGTVAAAQAQARWRVLPAEIRALDRPARRAIVAIALAGCVLRLLFWAYTDRTWEDALITVLHSENFARGLGLTHHHPGYPPVHGFTSPLSVLVPLAADIFHPGWGLGLLRIVSALAAVPTVLLAAAVALGCGVPIWLVYLLCGYVAFEHHQVLWGMAGMETQIATCVLFLALYCALKRNRRALAAAMALCLYARPDFALFLAVMAVYLWVADRPALWRSVPAAAALYAPWLIFTTWYYGSPVPNTIVAKGLGYHLWTRSVPVFSQAFVTQTWARVYDYIFLPLGPSFGGHGTGPLKFMDEGLIARVCLLLILAGAAALARRWRPFYILPLGHLAVYSLFYVYCVQGIFGWYLAPFSAVNCLLLVLGLAALMREFAIPARIPWLSRAAAIAYLLPLLVVLPITWRAERDIQAYIETPVRMAIGRYLGAMKRPGEAVACEPLGYIAYYSRMPVYDYPGLASPEVTGFLKQHPEGRMMERVLEHFKPAWIVLREHEYRHMLEQASMKFLETEYAVDRIFRSDPVRTPRIFRAGSNIDLTFYVLRKRT